MDCSWFNPDTDDKIDELRSNCRNDRKLVKLNAVANIKGGKRLPKGTVIVNSDPNVIPYIRATDVKDQKVNWQTAVKIPNFVHNEIRNYQLKLNDVVITIVGTIGEVGILEDKIDVCNVGENVAKVRITNNAILARYIAYFLESEFGKIQMEKFSVGSLQRKLSLASCKKLEVYIPTKNNEFDKFEQQKILNTVLGLFKKSSIQKQNAQLLIDKANSVVREKLKIRIPDEIEAKDCFVVNLHDDSTRLDALYNNPLQKILIASLKKYNYRDLGSLTKRQKIRKVRPSDFYRLVNLKQIDGNTGRITCVNEVPSLGSDKIPLKANSLLVTKLQPDSKKIVIVQDEHDGAVGSSELVPLTLDSEEVSLKFLWAVLRSEYVIWQWNYQVHGSSRMRIGKSEIEHTIVPIPEKSIQDEIVSEIEELILRSDEMLQKAENTHRKAKQLFISNVVGNQT